MSIDNVEDITPRIQYVASSGQTAFDYPFPIFEDADLVADVDGVTKALNTDYTVSGEGDDTGGTVTFLVGRTTGQIVTLSRHIAITRDTDIQQNGPWSSTDYNDEQDKTYLIMQQLQAGIDRSLRIPVTTQAETADMELGPVAAWANKFIYINSVGKPEPAAAVTGVSLSRSVIGGYTNPRTARESALGITPVDEGYPEGWADRYGNNAIPGVTDMWAAIDKAIRVMNTWTGNATDNPAAYTAGGDVTLLPVDYGVSTTVLMAPYVTLRCSTFTAFSGTGRSFRIQALAGFPATQYVVDTGNWRYKTQADVPVTPYRVVSASDQFYDTLDVVSTRVAPCPGASILGGTVDAANRAFGSVRMQCWSYGTIGEGIRCIGGEYAGLTLNSVFEVNLGTGFIKAPIALFTQGCTSLVQGGGELLLFALDAPTASWVSGNQALINTVFYAGAMASDTVNPTVWYNLARKCILAVWCGKLSFQALSTYGCTVAIELYRANLVVQHYENEFTGTAVFNLRSGSRAVVNGFSCKNNGSGTAVLATGDTNTKLTINFPQFVQMTSSFTALNSESSSNMEIAIYELQLPDPVLGATMRLSNINKTRIYNTRISGLPVDQTVTLFCSTAGSATLDGLFIATPATIDGALKFMENNPHITSWIINLKDAQTHTIAAAHTLKNLKLAFNKDFTGGAAPVLSASVSPILDNCILQANYITISGWSTNAFVKVIGILQARIGGGASGVGSPAISIPAAKTLFGAADVEACRILATGAWVYITFGAGAGLCNGGTDGYVNYEDAFAHASITGTAALEAITSGPNVKKIASTIV